MPGTEITPIGSQNKKKLLDQEFRMKVLEYLDRGGEIDECRRKFGLNRGTILKIVQGRIASVKSGGRACELAGAVNEQYIRTRLYDRAINAVEDSLDTFERMIEKTPILSRPESKYLVPIVVNHNRNRGQNGIKVLEGIGDFRRGGDDVPREIPRRPLFNLPPGAHVAVRMEITTGEQNETSSGRTIEAERLTQIAEGGAETVGTEI